MCFTIRLPGCIMSILVSCRLSVGDLPVLPLSCHLSYFVHGLWVLTQCDLSCSFIIPYRFQTFGYESNLQKSSSGGRGLIYVLYMYIIPLYSISVIDNTACSCGLYFVFYYRAIVTWSGNLPGLSCGWTIWTRAVLCLYPLTWSQPQNPSHTHGASSKSCSATTTIQTNYTTKVENTRS